MPRKSANQLLNAFHATLSSLENEEQAAFHERKEYDYKVAYIGPFDARRSCKRCSPAGVGVRTSYHRRATSDFWRHRSGCLLVRISSCGYVWHLEASRKDGKPISDEDIHGSFSDYMGDLLFDWMLGGIDELPDFCIDSEDED